MMDPATIICLSVIPAGLIVSYLIAARWCILRELKKSINIGIATFDMRYGIPLETK